jgi:GrpB-like predicted nucleotidyltransferase (UPF0157 family)
VTAGPAPAAEIEIAADDPAWPARFAAERAALEPALRHWLADDEVQSFFASLALDD